MTSDEALGMAVAGERRAPAAPIRAAAAHSILASLEEAVIVTDCEERVLSLNPAAVQLTGWLAADAERRALSEVLVLRSEANGQRVENTVGRVLCDRNMVELPMPSLLVARDGSERAVSGRGVPLRDDDGIVRGVVLSLRDVTRERNAERAAQREGARLRKALDASQARLNALYECGLIGIAVGTLDGKVLEINDALLETVGQDRHAVLSGTVEWSSLTPPEWRDGDRRATEELRSKGVVLREKEYVREDGARVPVLVGSTRLRGTEDEAISFVIDLTKNEQAAQAILQLRKVEASETRFRALLEAAPDAAVIVDGAGQIVLINTQTETLFGYERAELLGKPVEALIPERFRDRHVAHRDGYLLGPRRRSMGSGLELYGRRKDGSEFPVEISLSPLETAEGTLVSASIRDITERCKADEQRSRLAAIVDSSADAIIGKTLQGVITSWNDGAERIFGYTAAEVLGKSIDLLIPESRGNEEAQLLARLSQGERIEQFDTVRKRKDGTEIQVSLTSSPVRDSAGRLIGASKVVRDITERRHAAEALALAKEAAEAATRELEAFSYSVAHDLRAPLRGMNGFAQVLLSTYRGKFDAEGVDWLEEIVGNAKKMGELIDGLLSLARVTRGEVRPESVDLSELARELVAQLAAADTERAVDVQIQPQLSAIIDPRLARVLLGNLLGNAWKFTSRAASSRIEFGRSEGDRAPAFFVSDNGAGFDPAFGGKLFAPFQRLHAASEFPGTGIGLATVQRIVRRHGGEIWAEGAVDVGATFHFTLEGRA